MRSLILRERERTSMVWVLGNSLSGTSRSRTRRGRSLWNFWTHNPEKDEDEQLDDERFDGKLDDPHMSNYCLSGSIRSRSHSQTLSPNSPPRFGGERTLGTLREDGESTRDRISCEI